MFYFTLSISSLNDRFDLYFSNLHRIYKNYDFSKLKIALGKKKSIFDGTINTFYDIIIVMPNICGQSL